MAENQIVDMLAPNVNLCAYYNVGIPGMHAKKKESCACAPCTLLMEKLTVVHLHLVWGRRAWTSEGSQHAPGRKGDGGSGRLTREGGIHYFLNHYPFYASRLPSSVNLCIFRQKKQTIKLCLM